MGCGSSCASQTKESANKKTNTMIKEHCEVNCNSKNDITSKNNKKNNNLTYSSKKEEVLVKPNCTLNKKDSASDNFIKKKSSGVEYIDNNDHIINPNNKSINEKNNFYNDNNIDVNCHDNNGENRLENNREITQKSNTESLNIKKSPRRLEYNCNNINTITFKQSKSIHEDEVDEKDDKFDELPSIDVMNHFKRGFKENSSGKYKNYERNFSFQSQRLIKTANSMNDIFKDEDISQIMCVGEDYCPLIYNDQHIKDSVDESNFTNKLSFHERNEKNDDDVFYDPSKIRSTRINNDQINPNISQNSYNKGLSHRESCMSKSYTLEDENALSKQLLNNNTIVTASKCESMHPIWISSKNKVVIKVSGAWTKDKSYTFVDYRGYLKTSTNLSCVNRSTNYNSNKNLNVELDSNCFLPTIENTRLNNIYNSNNSGKLESKFKLGSDNSDNQYSHTKTIMNATNKNDSSNKDKQINCDNNTFNSNAMSSNNDNICKENTNTNQTDIQVNNDKFTNEIQEINKKLSNEEFIDGELICRVLGGKYFSIKDGLEFYPDSEGPLFFKMFLSSEKNDKNEFNRYVPAGRLMVTVSNSEKLSFQQIEHRLGWRIENLDPTYGLINLIINNFEKNAIILINKLRSNPKLFAHMYLDNFSYISSATKKLFNIISIQSKSNFPFYINKKLYNCVRLVNLIDKKETESKLNNISQQFHNSNYVIIDSKENSVLSFLIKLICIEKSRKALFSNKYSVIAIYSTQIEDKLLCSEKKEILNNSIGMKKSIKSVPSKSLNLGTTYRTLVYFCGNNN